MSTRESRSREGAWIEIAKKQAALQRANCRSREGAWIEIRVLHQVTPNGLRRSREGAWIEICNINLIMQRYQVAPARERGLKFLRKRLARMGKERRSREGAWIEIRQLAHLKMRKSSLPRGSVD